MGNQIMGKFRKNRFQGFSEDQIDYLDDKWDLIKDNSGEIVDPAKFADSYNISLTEAKKVLEIMDIDNSKTVTKYQFKVGAALLCQNPYEETIKLLFKVYDINNDGFVDDKDIDSFIKSLWLNLSYYNDTQMISQEELMKKKASLLQKWDCIDKDQMLSQAEFTAMMKKDPDIIQLMFNLGLANKDEINIEETDYDEIDTDTEMEMERRLLPRDERVERIKNGIEHNEQAEDNEEFGMEEEPVDQPWYQQIENFNIDKSQFDSSPPNAVLDLEYVYGYRCHDTRNNLRYSNKGHIVYHTAGVGIILDQVTNTQRHFSEHNDDISCLDLYEDMVLTGQVGLTPSLIIWSTDSCRLLCCWKDVFKGGISNCCFSNSGKLVAGIGMDDDHSVGIFNVEQSKNYRKDPKNKNTGIVAQGKLTKQEVFDIKFNPDGYQLIVAGMKEINIVSWKNGQVLAERCIWKSQKPQPALTVGFLDKILVTGMFSGHIFLWKKSVLDERNAVRAHSSPVKALYQRVQGKGIITADKRGIIMVWDTQLQKQFEIDVQDLSITLNYNQKKGHPNVISVCEGNDGRILFGTRTSEIVELINPEDGPKGLKAKVIMNGHYNGELWGLDTHPDNSTFFTVGEDEMLAQWDMKTKKKLKSVPNKYASKTLSISPDGQYVATGCTNGRVYIYKTQSLQLYKSFDEEIDPDKTIISLVKFSPKSDLLAVCYKQPISKIILLNTKSFQKAYEHKNCNFEVVALDFTKDQKNFQINTSLYTIEAFETMGNKLSDITALKGAEWATWTQMFGWQVSGIWPPCSDGKDINTVDKSKDGKCLVCGDDFGKVKLFQFPAVSKKQIVDQKEIIDKKEVIKKVEVIKMAGNAKYTGHSSYVCGVKFSADNERIISVGGDELSIFQWKYTLSANKLNIAPDEIVQQEEEADKQGFFGEEELDKGATIGAVKPFEGELKHSIPSWYKPNKAKYDVVPKGNLSLFHVMGFRYFYILDECRDMLGWTDKGKLCFATAALGVDMDIKTQEQRFFNKHEEDIVSFALHPNRQIAATGQMAQAGKAKCIDIYVWDIETKEVLAHFNQFHLRAIVLLKFSPDGTQLLSVGQDDDNSLCINDWQSNRQTATSNVCKAKVNAAAWKSEDEFVTCGMKHIKFWKLSGRNVSGKMGQQQGKFESQFSVVYAFDNAICVSGSGEGNIFAWKGGSADKAIKAHDGKVGSLFYDKTKKLLYSAGMDGKVVSWGYEGGNLVKKQDIVNVAQNSIFKSGIVALDQDPKTNLMLIGTVGAQIYQFDPTSKKLTLILQGHYGEELWSVCPEPSGTKFVSGGGDKYVRLWDIAQKRMLLASKPFPEEIRAVDWAQNGKFIICADLNGTIYLLDAANLSVQDTQETSFTQTSKKAAKGASKAWVEDLKISPCSKYVAFGAHGGASAVEVYDIAFPKLKHKAKINAGLTSALLHLDWSADSSILVVNSQAYELKFVSVSGAKNVSSSSCADVEFFTWTCKLGFPVQGIFSSADYTDVNTVCRSWSKEYLTTGEDSQKVILFQYPAVVPKQKRKEYIGHSSHVTRVRFTFDDQYLISTGGNDKTIIIWKTDFGNTNAKTQQKQIVQTEDDVEDADIDMPVKKTKKATISKQKHQDTKGENDLFETAAVDEGDQFAACKPWMGAIKEPTYTYYNNPKEQHLPPKCKIEIEYVHGYRSKDMRNNVYVLNNGKLLYNAAALGIVLDYETNTQTFFNKHLDDITAIDLNPVDRRTVATGELGAKPNIFVWDSDTMEDICNFKAPLQKGIVALNFTPSGKKLVAVANDVDHCIAVFDLQAKAAEWTNKGGPEVIVDLRWANETSFVSIGVKHFKLWENQNKQYVGKKGSFGKDASNMLSGVAINKNNDIIVGGSDGSVQIWKGNSFNRTLNTKHTLCCDAITVSNDFVLTGGRDGLVYVLNQQNYDLISQFDMKDILGDQSVCFSVRALYQDKNKIFVGTLGSEIFELNFKDGISKGKVPKPTAYMRGHFSPNLQWTNEVWGLDIFRENDDLFATCSDDGTLRIFSISKRQQINFGYCTKAMDGKDEPRDVKTKDLTDKCKARVIACHPRDEGFTLGMKDGTVRVFDADLKQTKIFKQAKEWISDIKFSPDGTTCVIGSHDNALYAYRYPEFKPIGNKMNKHSSYITHFDYSLDGINLHSTCGAYELLFWDVGKCKQLPGGASALRDELWHTWTVTLGWPVQGIWPECADGTDINSVDRSHDYNSGNDPKTSYHLVATGDDFSKVKILRYPSLKKSSKSVEGSGHSSHVTQVKWTKNDERIISAGGEDQCIIVWKVTKNA